MEVISSEVLLTDKDLRSPSVRGTVCSRTLRLCDDKNLNIVGRPFVEDPALFENLSHGGHFETSRIQDAKRGDSSTSCREVAFDLSLALLTEKSRTGGIVSEINTEEDVVLLGCS